VRVTVIEEPEELAVTFWYWSMRVIFAVMERPLPVPDCGDIVHANDVEPTVPVQVTVAAPLCVDTLLKLSPAAAAAFTVIVAEPITVGEVADAVRVFDPAAYRVADRAVVLTPLVKDTEPVG
jgi:hypothetical protein